MMRDKVVVDAFEHEERYRLQLHEYMEINILLETVTSRFRIDELLVPRPR